MSTANNDPDVPQQDQTPAEHSRSQNALAWATVGLSAACCTSGVILCLAGYEDIGAALVMTGAAPRK